ncbi:GNAT family N-acetyltransferase [Lysobacter firmicutimachus]|uniref:GNAT family N-acetyltransferase n=1 Tax=Lysobacter firmicutimachus TaxID=1792846 RepID=A0AAU8MPA4_9GAMM
MHGPTPTLSFPPPHRGGPCLRWPESLSAQGVSLRAARDDDIEWLRLHYRERRAAEFAPLGWPAAALTAFLDQQFAMQHLHYTRYYADAQFLIVERGDAPIGRLYLLRRAPEHLLVDIGLAPGQRGQGLGAALIGGAQADAAECGRGLRLHVEHGNASARRLYERLGFEHEEDLPTHAAMRWRAPAPRAHA